MQQFHPNIEYKTWILNRVIDFINQPLVAALTTMLHSYGHEAFEWPQLYQRDPDIATTYHLLGTCVNAIDFHIQDGLLCHLDHLCVPSSDHAKLIWETHYSRIAWHFGMEKIMVVLQKHFIGQKFNRTSTSISNLALLVPFTSQPSISKAYTPIFLHLIIHIDGLHV